jgi:hypothetical protein
MRESMALMLVRNCVGIWRLWALASGSTRSSLLRGKSQALQMDKGLQKARAGIALLTPAYLVGRFWTERELGALLHKETLIPVLHGVTFDEVAEYSGILPDLAGFETARDSVEVIAQKIAAAVLRE